MYVSSELKLQSDIGLTIALLSVCQNRGTERFIVGAYLLEQQCPGRFRERLDRSWHTQDMALEKIDNVTEPALNEAGSLLRHRSKIDGTEGHVPCKLEHGECVVGKYVFPSDLDEAAEGRDTLP